jgi:hypothetical protein
MALGAALALVLGAPAALAVSGYLVSDSQRQCIPAEQGVPGIAGYTWQPTCPQGYTIVQQPPAPQPPLWQRILDALDSWLGLSSRVVWVPTAKQLLLLSTIILLLRRAMRWVSGWRTIVLSTVVAWLTYYQGAVADGSLTAYEALAGLLATVAGAAGLWEIVKRLVRKPSS